MTISAVSPASTVKNEPPHEVSVFTCTPSCIARRLVAAVLPLCANVAIISMRTLTALLPLLAMFALNRLFACCAAKPERSTF